MDLKVILLLFFGAVLIIVCLRIARRRPLKPVQTVSASPVQRYDRRPMSPSTGSPTRTESLREPVRAAVQTPQPLADVDRPAPSSQELRTRLNAATTEEEVADLYDETPSGSPVEREVLERHKQLLLERLATATTVDECEEVRESILTDEGKTGEGSVGAAADQKIDALLAVELEAATDYQDAERIYEQIPGEDCEDKGDLGHTAVLKMIELCSTNESCLALFDYLDDENVDDETNGALLVKALQLAIDLDEVDAVENRVTEDFGPSDEEIAARKVSMAESIEDCAEIWDAAGEWDDASARAAICRAADIIRAEDASKQA